MPNTKRTIRAAGTTYLLPFVGPHTDYVAALRLDPSDFTTAEIDADGYIKAGTPIRRTGAGTGALVSGASQFIYGVVVEPFKVAASNGATDLTAAAPLDISLMTIGQVRRAALEDQLGRALTANELAAFDAAGCLIRLIH